ncbi:MAG: hypothetical protein OXI33_14950 [Chloroflexota bacterium]|nr:hypothetical protein [Chloroflexota bacterium]
MPPDRILEARKTYAELAEACRSLREQSTALEKNIASLRTEVSGVRREMSRLHDEVDEERQRIRDAVDERAAAFADFRRGARREWVFLGVFMVGCGFFGAVLADMAASFSEWLRSAVASWWAG